MRADEPRVAVFKGSLEYIGTDGTITIPIFIYRKDSEIRQGGVEFHKYHASCDGRIQYRNFCPDCACIVEEVDIVKRADYGGDAVEVDRTEIQAVTKDELNGSVELLGTVPYKSIPPLINGNKLAFHAMFEVRGFKTGTKKKEILPSSEKQVRLVLDALAKIQSAMYVRVPLRTGTRYGLLFSSGDLYTLLYEEEIRSDIEWKFAAGEGYNKSDLSLISQFLKSKEMPIDGTPSMNSILTKVDDVLSRAASGIKAAPVEDAPTGRIKIGDFETRLKQAIEESKKKKNDTEIVSSS